MNIKKIIKSMKCTCRVLKVVEEHMPIDPYERLKVVTFRCVECERDEMVNIQMSDTEWEEHKKKRFTELKKINIKTKGVSNG